MGKAKCGEVDNYDIVKSRTGMFAMGDEETLREYFEDLHNGHAEERAPFSLREFEGTRAGNYLGITSM